MTVAAAATWLDAEFIDEQDPNFGLTPNETTDRVYSLFASYEFHKGTLKGFGLGFTVLSVGDRISIRGNRNVHADGHERVDLHAFYEPVPGLDLWLQVRNLFDETYIERNNGNFAHGHYFGAPRSILGRLTYKF